MHVNRPPTLPASGGADGRLYLREAELDLGAELLRAAARRLIRRARNAAGAKDLLDAELDIVIELLNAEGIDVSEMRARLDAPKQSLARNLKSLENKGFIARRPCPKDGRRRLLSLTEIGRDLASRAAAGWREALLDAYKAAGPESVAGARSLLQAIAADENSAQGGA
ncbi:MAG: MarR family transcriptional regulator [Pseudomonadota bacterium]